MGSYVIGMSADGSVVLMSDYDPISQDEVVSLVDTRTGSSIKLDLPADARTLSPRALSADGKSVAGSYESITTGHRVAFIWTKDKGVTLLPTANEAEIHAISADGSAVAGYMQGSQFYWSADIGFITLGTLGGRFTSYARAISADGSTVIGSAYDASDKNRAFVWTKGQSGLTNIDTLFDSSAAGFVTADGAVVAGTGYTALWASRGFRWTAAGGMVDIGDLGGGNTDVLGLSRDGNVLVGSSNDGTSYKAFRYEAAAGQMTNLGTLGGYKSEAMATNADGSVVVGSADNANNNRQAFRWTQQSGMLTIEQWLSDNGVTSISFDAAAATHVSDDGNVVAGTTSDSKTFYARVGKSSGVIELETFLPTVATASATAVSSHLRSADTVMFGAQGQPMRNLLTPGQKAVWGTVDLARDSSNNAQGGLAVGEMGFGYGLTDGVTVRLGAGVIHNDFDLSSGGNVATTGAYISPEASIALLDNVYFTFGGYVGTGTIKTNRGYLNGGVLDFSTGETNANTFGAKVRLDWVDALVIDDTSFTPYVGLSFASTSTDGYTENGGSFPVAYEAVTEHSTIARVGADMVYNLTDDFRVVAKAELAYQFEGNSSQVNGTIVGLNSFSLPAQSQNQFWVRGGIGAEYDIGGGTASVMLNVTSRGQDPDVWIRSNFTMKF
jgi:probable HAF family extracellular repeat protein